MGDALGLPQIGPSGRSQGLGITCRERMVFRQGVLEVVVAESHNWLGAVERKHQVVRRALELFMDEEGGRNETNLVKAAIYVPQQINSLSIHKRYTPTQWVMGKSTQTQISLRGVNPGIQPLDDQGDQGTLAQVQKRRLNAQIAFLKADTDARLRRAMNQNFRENQEEVTIGQLV